MSVPSLAAVSSRDVAGAVVNGLVAAGVEYVAPRSLEPGAGRSGMKSFKTGAAAAGATIVNDALGISSYIPDNLISNPMVKQAVGDGITFTAIEAGRSKAHRSGKRVLMNLLYGTGISAVGSGYIYPAVAAPLGLPPPASPVVVTNQAPATTSPGFST